MWDRLLQTERAALGVDAAGEQDDRRFRRDMLGKEPRDETGRRYVAVLAELPVDAATGLPASSTAIARQSLEVLLASEVRAVTTAQAMLAALDKAAAAGQFDMREAEEEIAYRRLQLAMLSDRWADVEAALAPFGGLGP